MCQQSIEGPTQRPHSTLASSSRMRVQVSRIVLLQPACFRCGGSGPLPFLQVFRNFNYMKAQSLDMQQVQYLHLLACSYCRILSIAWHVRLQPT